MQIINLLTPIAVLIGSVSAACHGSGERWPGSQNTMISYAERECRTGALTGVFGPNRSKYACIQFGSDAKIEFVITNLNRGASFDLQDQHCIDNLVAEIRGCAFGGRSEKSGWVFSADPNRGRCR